MPLTSPVDAIPAVRAAAAPPPVFPGSYLQVEGVTGASLRSSPSAGGWKEFPEGVTAEVIGATGFDMGAAAADEIDRFDPANGSPWGIVVASAGS